MIWWYAYSRPHAAAYHAEKVNPLRESKAPAYSFGLKTGQLQMKSTTPSPNSYTLPSLIGSNIVGKRSNAAYSITGRSKIGSFHEDLRKVRREFWLAGLVLLISIASRLSD